MTVGRERIKNWCKKYSIAKGKIKIYNGTGYGINIEDTLSERITIVTTSVRKSSVR